MPSNLIILRVSNFFKENPPFSFLKEEDIKSIAEQTTIRYVEKNQIIFSEGDPEQEEFYVLKQGLVDLFVGNSERVDTCDIGDLFGVRSILSGNPYVMTAKATAESLVYVIPSKVLVNLIESNAKVAAFFASGLASGQVVLRGDKIKAHNTAEVTLSDTHYLSSLRSENTVIRPKEVLNCTPTTSIQVAAQLMSTWDVGSIIVMDENERPLGIVTDTDLRNKVVAKNKSMSEPVQAIMSSPVMTIAPDMNLMELILKMIESERHHIVVTEDGSDQTKVIGLVSDHDVLLEQANHPAALLKGLKSSNTIEELSALRNKAEKLLRLYLEHDIDAKLISEFITAINDGLIVKAIELAKKELLEKFHSIEEVSFTWINFGSEGRKEQLLRTDLDNAIIFEDSSNAEKIQGILLPLASKVIDILNECGFAKCPANMMASNPEWCQPLSKWKNYFSRWIQTPGTREVMKTTIFLDYRHIYGAQAFIDELDDHIRQEIDQNNIYLNHLAKNATQSPPPLGFFNNLIVEKSGKNEDQFDIKARAMMPLIDAARVLCLEHRVFNTKSTIERYKWLIEKEPGNAELYGEAILAFEIFLKMRAKQGLKNRTSGRFIEIEKLNKLEKKILRNAFLPITDLQRLLDVRYRLSYFN